MAPKRKAGGGRYTPPGGTLLCPVCTKRPADTKEDIVPNWARRRIRAFGQYPGNQLPSELMPMCRQCNSAFGKLYENEAALVIGPMVSGEQCLLSISDQQLVGRWIIKTMMVFYLARADLTAHQLRFVRDIVSHMKVYKTPPHQSFVRIGSLNPHQAADHSYLHPHKVGPLPRNVLFGVASLGWLVWEMAVGDPRVMEPFVSSCLDNDALVRVWPPQLVPLPWPPPTRCTESDLYTLRHAWRAGKWPPPPSGGQPMTNPSGVISAAVRAATLPPKPPQP